MAYGLSKGCKKAEILAINDDGMEGVSSAKHAPNKG